MTTKAEGSVEANSGGWRFNVGVAIIVLIFAVWLLIPLAAAMDASAGTIGKITGAILIGNKVLLLLAVAIMGKDGFQQLKRRLFARLAPEPMVSALRYRIGLVMFCLPLISALLEPYVDNIWPGLRPNLWQAQLAGDLMLIGSFFVLGGNFWDKLRALFVRTATVVDTGNTARA